MIAISNLLLMTMVTGVWAVNVALEVVIVGLIVFYIVSHRRERQVKDKWEQNNDRLSLILETSGVRVWTYDVATERFTWLSQAGMEKKVCSSMDFARRFSREDFDRLHHALRMVADGEKDRMTLDMVICGADDADNTAAHNTVTTLSVLHRDSSGRPTTILATRTDVTEELQRQQRVKDAQLRYRGVFETAMVGLAYFDADGVLVEVNQKVCDTFGLDHDRLIARHTTVYELSGLRPDELSLEHMEPMYFTQMFNKDIPNRFVKPTKRSDYFFYEVHMQPVYDADHRLLGICSTGRDVTEAAMTYWRRKTAIEQLFEANYEVMTYVENIDFTLKTGGMRMVQYSPDTHMMTVYSGIGHVERELTQLRVLSLLDNSSVSKAIRLFNSMDNRSATAISEEVKTMLPMLGGQRLYLQVNFVANIGNEGRVTDYFGMCRDITNLKATEQQLAIKSAKAQEVENIKNAFLRNMSYEIRTPLNTVVGFAELFENKHTPEEEQIFVNEIKNNAARLLKLINSILFLSRLDAHMIDINPQPIDFVSCFDVYCQQGWSLLKKEGVKYVVEMPYEHLVVNVDASNLEKIIGQVTANAAEYTTAGTVRARCDYVNDRLLITVTDTGSGIDPETMAHLYERFVSGSHKNSGLGLSICHELLEQMGGNIQVKSDVGKGTSVWITLPCEANEIVRI